MGNIKIKVVGIGGGGGKIVSRIYKKDKVVEYIAVNTDLQDLKQCKADKLLQIGKQTTNGMGAGMDVSLAEKCAQENINDALEAVLPSNIVLLVSCFGGGTGTGATPFIAQKIKEKDRSALLLAVVALPFSFEGSFRKNIALRGINALKDNVDALFVLENDNIISLSEKDTTLKESFSFCDQFISKIINSLLELITGRGVINVDFVDVKNSLKNAGQVYFAQGEGRGENRIDIALNNAFSDNVISDMPKKAKTVLFSVHGGNFTLEEISEISKSIKSRFANPKKVYFGAFQDKTLKNSLKITIFACQGK